MKAISKRNLGIDIGSQGVRVVEIENSNGRATLTNYGYAKYPELIDLSLQSKDSAKAVTVALGQIMKQAKFSTNKAYGVMPGHLSFNKIFEFSKKYTQEDIKKWVAANVIQKVFPKTKTVVNYQLLENKSDKNITVLVSVVSESLVEKYRNIFNKADLKLLGLETSFHSLIRSLIGTDALPTMILDVGNKFTDIVIVSKGVPYVSKSFELGGDNATRHIAASMNIGVKEAEQMRVDSDMFMVNDNNRIKGMLSQELVSAASEFEDYGKIEKILVTGGCSKDSKLIDEVGILTNTKTYIGNPWGRVVFPKSIDDLIKEISPHFSVALGAAMKSI